LIKMDWYRLSADDAAGAAEGMDAPVQGEGEADTPAQEEGDPRADVEKIVNHMSYLSREHVVDPLEELAIESWNDLLQENPDAIKRIFTIFSNDYGEELEAVTEDYEDFVAPVLRAIKEDYDSGMERIDVVDSWINKLDMLSNFGPPGTLTDLVAILRDYVTELKNNGG
jgi:hypothetical protein